MPTMLSESARWAQVPRRHRPPACPCMAFDAPPCHQTVTSNCSGTLRVRLRLATLFGPCIQRRCCSPPGRHTDRDARAQTQSALAATANPTSTRGVCDTSLRRYRCARGRPLGPDGVTGRAPALPATHHTELEELVVLAMLSLLRGLVLPGGLLGPLVLADTRLLGLRDIRR